MATRLKRRRRSQRLIDVENLAVGGAYQTRWRVVPLMPNPDPDPGELRTALGRALRLPPRATIVVEERRTVTIGTHGVTWYRVQAQSPTGRTKASGWLRASALLSNVDNQ